MCCFLENDSSFFFCLNIYLCETAPLSSPIKKKKLRFENSYDMGPLRFGQRQGLTHTGGIWASSILTSKKHKSRPSDRVVVMSWKLKKPLWKTPKWKSLYVVHYYMQADVLAWKVEPERRVWLKVCEGFCIFGGFIICEQPAINWWLGNSDGLKVDRSRRRLGLCGFRGPCAGHSSGAISHMITAPFTLTSSEAGCSLECRERLTREKWKQLSFTLHQI